MSEIVLSTKALSKQYSSGRAVDNVNITISKGDIYGFIGENGAGKTTLIRLVTSLVAPTEGSISLFGSCNSEQLNEARKRIGCIIESPAFFPNLSARDNLEYYRIQRGISNKNEVEKSLTTVNLNDTGKKKYSHFSLGMKQRLGLALAIMGNPDFLILDEPINGLDPMGIVEFRTIIRNLNREYGMTILISSHILSELSQIATQYGIIHQGRLIKELSHKELEEETKRCIAVKVDNPTLAATIIEEKLKTTDFVVLPENEIRIFACLNNPSEVTFQLSSNGVRVDSIKEVGTNLEEYFLNAIGHTNVGGQ